MKYLVTLTAALAAFPALAHTDGQIAHVHPHGGEIFIALAVIAAAMVGYMALRKR